jgi:hypothetical protein
MDQNDDGHDSAESSGASCESEPEDTHPVGAQRADALRTIAAQFLTQADKGSGSASGRYQVVVHIDQQLLSQKESANDESNLCEYESTQPLAIETARRLACDGSLVGMVDDAAGEPLSVGRKTRTIPPALARALKARDGGCRFPGCHHTRYTEGHHVEHWANGGETKLSNLITLCHHHHHIVHEGGFRVLRTDDGVFVFRRPDGKAVRTDFATGRRFRGSVLAEVNAQRDIRITPTTLSRWRGEAMDYSLAIDALLNPPGLRPADRTASRQ